MSRGKGFSYSNNVQEKLTRHLRGTAYSLYVTILLPRTEKLNVIATLLHYQHKCHKSSLFCINRSDHNNCIIVVIAK